MVKVNCEVDNEDYIMAEKVFGCIEIGSIEEGWSVCKIALSPANAKKFAEGILTMVKEMSDE